jgi:hypothetical protein
MTDLPTDDDLDPPLAMPDFDGVLGLIASALLLLQGGQPDVGDAEPYQGRGSPEKGHANDGQ